MAWTVAIDGKHSVRIVEYLAAAVIFCIVAAVLYMVFGWKPF
jgi:hypothetical protein